MIEFNSLIKLQVDLLLLVNVHDVDDFHLTVTGLSNDLLAVVHQEHVSNHRSVHVEEWIATLVQVIVQSKRWDEEERVGDNS